MHPTKIRMPDRRIKFYDFGNPKFGQSQDKPNFVGRRVDCLVRSIDTLENEEIELSIQRYLKDGKMQGKTETARLLAAKAVILLEPNCGKVIWP